MTVVLNRAAKMCVPEPLFADHQGSVIDSTRPTLLSSCSNTACNARRSRQTSFLLLSSRTRRTRTVAHSRGLPRRAVPSPVPKARPNAIHQSSLVSRRPRTGRRPRILPTIRTAARSPLLEATLARAREEGPTAPTTVSTTFRRRRRCSRKVGVPVSEEEAAEEVAPIAAAPQAKRVRRVPATRRKRGGANVERRERLAAEDEATLLLTAACTERPE